MESESKQCDRCNVEKVQLLLCDESWTDSTDSIIQNEHAHAHISYWQSELLTSCHHRYSINKTMTELQSFRKNIKSDLIVSWWQW